MQAGAQVLLQPQQLAHGASCCGTRRPLCASACHVHALRTHAAAPLLPPCRATGKPVLLENVGEVLDVSLEPLLARRLPQAQAVPRFPAVRRDIAVDLPETVSWSQIEQTVRHTLGERLKELRLFDRYSGKGVEAGRKSLAMGLILQDASRTLTDDDADRCVREAVTALEKACKARLRG